MTDTAQALALADKLFTTDFRNGDPDNVLRRCVDCMFSLVATIEELDNLLIKTAQEKNDRIESLSAQLAQAREALEMRADFGRWHHKTLAIQRWDKAIAALAQAGEGKCST